MKNKVKKIKKLNKRKPLKALEKIAIIILPGLVVAGLVFSTNVYFDLDKDLGRIMTWNDQEFKGTVYLGAMEFAEDSGEIAWIDMPITAESATGTVHSYTARIDSQNILTIYAEADGTGGIQNKRVGIATTTPEYTLDINGDLRVTATTTVGSFIMPTGASDTYVLTSDASGVGTWQELVAGSGDISGTGTANHLARWTDSTTITTSTIYDTGSFIGIGLTSPSGDELLGIDGDIYTSGSLIVSDNTTTTNLTVTTDSQLGTVTSGIWQGTTIGTQYGGTGITSYTQGDIIYSTEANVLGNLSIGADGTVLTSSGSAPQWSDSLNLAGTLDVAGTTTIGAFQMATGASNNYVLTSDASGVGTWGSLSDIGGVTGTGTTNHLARWTGSTTITTSTIYDTGSFIGIATSTPQYTLDINGTLGVAGTSTFAGHVLPATTTTYTLGSENYKWANIYSATGTFGSGTITIGSSSITGTGTTTLSTTGNSNQFVLGDNGNIGIGISTPPRRLSVYHEDSSAQLRLSYDASRYSDFQVDAIGDLNISSEGGNIWLDNENLWVCAGGACGSATTTGQGNIIVESAYIFGNEFRLEQTSATTVTMYDSIGAPIIIFDEE